jgi:signal transduction histidine kinase
VLRGSAGRPGQAAGAPGSAPGSGPGSEPDSLLDSAPTGLAGVDTLAASARAAGLVVDVELDVPAGTLDGAIDAAAYRVVQESLTNVLRHAAATRVRVSARVAGDRLALRVADDGRGAGPGLVPGSGIWGMRERVAMLGGTLTTTDAPGGGFRVAADLPLRLETGEP